MKKKKQKKATRIGKAKKIFRCGSFLKNLIGRFRKGGIRKAVFTSAVIVAGGSSQRFGGEIPKQFLPLDGLPVVVHTLLAFEKSSVIDEIIVVCRPGDEERYRDYAERYGLTKFKKAVAGGDTRQKSALRGAEATDPQARYLLIHDAARPLVRKETIRDVALAAHDYRAACAAAPAKDTIKVVAADGYIEKTIDRSQVYLAATPQGFYRSLYLSCALVAAKEGVEVTDDAALLEHYHYPVRIVDCGDDNRKITTPADLLTAESILKERAICPDKKGENKKKES